MMKKKNHLKRIKKYFFLWRISEKYLNFVPEIKAVAFRPGFFPKIHTRSVGRLFSFGFEGRLT